VNCSLSCLASKTNRAKWGSELHQTSLGLRSSFRRPADGSSARCHRHGCAASFDRLAIQPLRSPRARTTASGSTTAPLLVLLHRAQREAEAPSELRLAQPQPFAERTNLLWRGRRRHRLGLGQLLIGQCVAIPGHLRLDSSSLGRDRVGNSANSLASSMSVRVSRTIGIPFFPVRVAKVDNSSHLSASGIACRADERSVIRQPTDRNGGWRFAYPPYACCSVPLPTRIGLFALASL
jgi:hypothetical protein